jgi:hypothetical protein
MALTDYQAAYLAHLLTLRRAAGGVSSMCVVSGVSQIEMHTRC